MMSNFKYDLRDLPNAIVKFALTFNPSLNNSIAGELPGDRIAGMNYIVFKVRLNNSNAYFCTKNHTRTTPVFR
jgi:hypothetical protein